MKDDGNEWQIDCIVCMKDGFETCIVMVNRCRYNRHKKNCNMH